MLNITEKRLVLLQKNLHAMLIKHPFILVALVKQLITFITLTDMLLYTCKKCNLSRTYVAHLST